jgi:hypothetical protein
LLTVDGPTPHGGTITGGAEPAQVKVNLGSSEWNLSTGDTSVGGDKTLKLGAAFIGGMSFSFDPKAFRAADSRNQTCRNLLAGAQ